MSGLGVAGMSLGQGKRDHQEAPTQQTTRSLVHLLFQRAPTISAT
jgi:hypothetical protein